MAEVVVQNFVTLDGVMQGPGGADEDRENGFTQGGWVQGYSLGTVISDWERNVGALLLGRKTYDIWSQYWPFQDQQDTGLLGELTRTYNRVPKYIASHTKSALDWDNSAIIGADLASEVRAACTQANGEVRVWGSSGLIRSLAGLDLIDEYRLMTYPVVLGAGKRLFPQGFPAARFRLENSQALESGVVINTYRRT